MDRKIRISRPSCLDGFRRWSRDDLAFAHSRLRDGEARGEALSFACRFAIAWSLCAMGASGCRASIDGGRSIESRPSIRITGSDTMINLVQAFAETYRDVDPGVSVQVAGGGSGVGIAGLIVPLAAVTGYLVVKAWPALSWELVTRNPSRFNLLSIAIRYRLRSRAKW